MHVLGSVANKVTVLSDVNCSILCGTLWNVYLIWTIGLIQINGWLIDWLMIFRTKFVCLSVYQGSRTWNCPRTHFRGPRIKIPPFIQGEHPPLSLSPTDSVQTPTAKLVLRSRRDWQASIFQKTDVWTDQRWSGSSFLARRPLLLKPIIAHIRRWIATIFYLPCDSGLFLWLYCLLRPAKTLRDRVGPLFLSLSVVEGFGYIFWRQGKMMKIWQWSGSIFRIAIT